MSNLLEGLQARFPAGEVKQRKGTGSMMLDYIDIPQTINRLREVAGMDVSWYLKDAQISWREEETENGTKYMYMALVTGHLEVTDGEKTSTWSGVGAHIDRDPDMAIKTAQAEAIKKAGHGFGIALYLWDPQEREAIAKYRDYAKSGTPEALKRAVTALAVAGGADRTKESIAAYFGLDEGDLDNPDALRKLLEP